jgi:hypothetical protein
MPMLFANRDPNANIYFDGEDSASNGQIYARINSTINDPTSTSEDATLRFAVVTAGTVANEIDLTGTAMSPTASDGLALGTSSLQFADLSSCGLSLHQLMSLRELRK